MAVARGVVWVTGASSGIGLATALHLARQGYDVAASARNEDALNRLAARDSNIVPFPLDVADPIAREDTFHQLRKQLGPVDILVNNAGYGLRGAVEDIASHELRDIFDVNVFAPIALAKLVLPEMRARRDGRIIMVSSLVGRVSPPISGSYAATKHALEALSDAMRVELRPWQIKVVLVEPGPIRTSFASVAREKSLRRLLAQQSPYAEAYERFLHHPPGDANQAWGAASVADVIRKAVEDPNPRNRYPVHPLAVFLPLLNRLLPGALRDRLFAARFGFLREDERRLD